jgi:calcium-dependent protein kinase
MRQLLSAIVYCHKNNVVHRNLKSENLLFESQERNATLRVIDFGMSQVFTPHIKRHKEIIRVLDIKMSVKIGTPLYIAPEVLLRSYTEKCDVWSYIVRAIIRKSSIYRFK